MTKNELAKEVAVSEKLHLSTSIQAVDGVFRVIKETLVLGQPIVIRGFGSILPYDVAERVARNPQTGKPIVVPAHKSAKLRVSKDLVAQLNSTAGKEAAL